MNFPNYFADAESSFDDAEFVIFGVPYDKTSSFRHGAHQAPSEIRRVSWNFETYGIKTGVDLKDVRFHDHGNLDVKNDDRPEAMIKKVKEFTLTLLKKNKFPIVVGGEHSITAGVVQAFSKDIAVLSLDAHLDFREKYEDEVYSHACVTRRVADHVSVDGIVVLGVRSAEKEEFEDAEEQGLFYIDSFAIREEGIKRAIDEVKNYLKNKPVYFSLDIDVIDPAYAPGTSNPEPFGLTSFDVLACINGFSSRLVGFDVMEVCPPYDKGETALLAARFIRYVIECVVLKQI